MEEGIYRNISLRHRPSVVCRQGQKILQVYVAEVGWDRLAEVRAFLGSVIAGLVRRHLVPTRTARADPPR